MTTVERLFADYAFYHQTTGNKWCHRFGIPMIMFSLLAMLARVHLVKTESLAVDAAIVLVAAVSLYYLRLEWRLGVAMVALSIGMWLLGRVTPFYPALALFIAGWILQFLGHGVWEKRQPAFFRNLTHLLIGPLWILNDVIRGLGVKGIEARGEGV